MNLRFASAASLLAAFLWLAGVASAESILHGVGGDFKGFDPVDSGDVESADQISRVYEGLVEYHYLDRPYHVIPRLAAALPEIAPDGLTYTFRIRRGVRFPDDPCFPGGKGRELTAQDFVDSFQRVLDPRLQSQGDWIFVNHVRGAKAWVEHLNQNPSATTNAPVFDGFIATDRYTLEIRLAQPYPQLLWVLTMPYAFVVPREAVEYYGKDFRNHPVGTGPYRLVKWRRNYRIEFERNPFFSGQTYPTSGEAGDREAGLLADAGRPLPLLDRIIEYDIREFYTTWQMFLGGQLFSSGVNKDYFEKVITPELGLTPALTARGIQLIKAPSLSTYYIGFNMLDPVVGQSTDPAVNDRHRKLRQAFAAAIDVKKYCEVLTNNRNTPANSLLPPGVAGYTDAPYPYAFNRERAKQLLAEAGYPAGKDAKGNPLRLTMIMPGAGSTDARQAADFYVEQLRAIGVELEVQQLTFAEYLRRQHEGETQTFFAGWVIDYPDAQNFLQLFYGPNKCPGVNSSNYQNPEFDRLYEKIVSMNDSPERTAIYEQMVQLVIADTPWALMTYPLGYGLFQPWFKNYKHHAFPYANWKYYNVSPH
ncbi:MAG: Heme-binding protein A [Verrucomicrobiae bacterium]|nr:Heme-binding protein A [Verrucomicrobiae bacterium]